MSETGQALIDVIQTHSGGTMRVDSIFRFQDAPEEFVEFLTEAKVNGVTIVFENENEKTILRLDPYGQTNLGAKPAT